MVRDEEFGSLIATANGLACRRNWKYSPIFAELKYLRRFKELIWRKPAAEIALHGSSQRRSTRYDGFGGG